MGFSRRFLSATIGAIIVVTTAVAAAPAYADSDATTTVSGRVTLDGVPTSGLTVCVGGSLLAGEIVTDYVGCELTGADGSYSIAFDFPGHTDMAMVWVKPGTTANGRAFPFTGFNEVRGVGGYIQLTQGDHQVDRDIAVTTYPLISGKVVDQDGAPVAGATVSAGATAVVTDADGSYAVQALVAYDGGQVNVVASGYLPGALRIGPQGKVVGSTTVVLVKQVHKLVASQPVIIGSAKVRKTLTAVAGTWGPDGVTLGYQWYRNGKKISGATAASYRLTKSDRKKKITVVVTGKLAGYDAVSLRSAATRKIAAR
jgi:hypothetical protein